MIFGPTLRKLAAKGGRVYRIHSPAGPTTPAYTNHYATKAQRDKDHAESMEHWPTEAALHVLDDVPAASLDLSAPLLI